MSRGLDREDEDTRRLREIAGRHLSDMLTRGQAITPDLIAEADRRARATVVATQADWPVETPADVAPPRGPHGQRELFKSGA